MRDPYLMRLRAEVHLHLDPIWQQAAFTGDYTPKEIRKFTGPGAYYFEQVARSRVYAWLAERMGMTREECHAAKFTAEQCEQAIAILADVSFAEVRSWAKRCGLKVRRWYDAPAPQTMCVSAPPVQGEVARG